MGIVALFAVIYFSSIPFIQQVVIENETASAKTVLNNVYDMANKISKDLKNYHETLLQEKKQELRNIIGIAAAYAQWLDNEVKNGKMTQAKAKDIFLDYMRHLSFGTNKDYLWASDYSSRLVSHPDPKLNNADFSKKQDLRGNLIVPPMVEGALAHGDGFHSYWWNRLNEKKEIEKLTYYKNIPWFSLVIGTGVYIDDLESKYEAIKADAIAQLRAHILETHIAKTGYLFIFDGQDMMIVHPNPDIEGKNVSQMQPDPITKKPIMTLLKGVADKNDGLHYKWNKPSDSADYIYDKLSWVRYHPALDWYIGSSVYMDELNESANTLKNRMLDVFLFTILISILLLFFFVRKLTDPLKKLSETAKEVENGNLGARCLIYEDDEIGIVATAFDGMLDRLEDNIKNLDTKITQRTAELERANNELIVLDKLKSNLLSSVSHELRTPTTSIIGFSKLIKKKLEESVFPKVLTQDATLDKTILKMSQNLQTVINESERLTTIIDSIMDGANLDAKPAKWNFVKIEPKQLIMSVIQTYKSQANEKNIKISMPDFAELPQIMADEEHLVKVFDNLLSNAVKFTDSGEISLIAETRGDFVLFGIRDTGIGIEPEYIDKIFEKFSQVGDLLTNKPSGTGIGLFICKQIVEQHGGTIWAESSKAGSTFYFTIPKGLIG